MNKLLESTPLSPTATRIKHLVQTVSGGSQRAFAALIGCSHVAISKILSGRSEPGGKVLHLIGGIPNINGQWLRTGAGSPLLDDLSSNNQPSIPIASELVPGTLQAHKRLRTGRALFVAASMYNDATYAVEAQLAAPAPSRDAEHMRPDDLIVIDGDVSLWRPSPAWLTGRLVVVAKEGVAELHRIKAVSDKQVEVETRAEDRAWPASSRERPDRLFSSLELAKAPPTGESSDRQEAVPVPATNVFSLTEVVGVVTQLIRVY